MTKRIDAEQADVDRDQLMQFGVFLHKQNEQGKHIHDIHHCNVF